MKSSKLALTSVLVLGTLAGVATPAMAADKTQYSDAYGDNVGTTGESTLGDGGATSYGVVKLTPGDSTTGPTDPTDPTFPGGETGNEGNLRIDNVTPLIFGTHELGAAGTYAVDPAYYSKLAADGTAISPAEDATEVHPNIQVTDNRGVADGWKVSVKAGTFKTEDLALSLVGATITYKTPTKISTSSIADTTKIVVADETTVSADGSATTDFITAPTDAKATATTTVKYDAANVTLSVPKGNLTGLYKTTMTWTMTDSIA